MTNHSAEIAKVLAIKKSKSNFPDLISRKCWSPSPPPAANRDHTKYEQCVCVCIKPQGFREFHIPSGKKIKITSTEMGLHIYLLIFGQKRANVGLAKVNSNILEYKIVVSMNINVWILI
jgi:hypothetical protein